VVVAAIIAAAPLSVVLSPRVVADTAAAAAMSGVSIDSLSVSPAYMRSGVVVAAGAMAKGCTSGCTRLMISGDRGDSWRQAGAAGWRGGHPVITVGGNGREVLFDASTSSVQRSDDLGATWSDVGAGGNPTASPAFAADNLVAVAGKSDYVMRDTSSTGVPGSHGQMTDGSWALIPGYPASGERSPVFLGGVNAAGKSTLERCDMSFSCSSPVVLPVPDAFSGQPLMLPSTAYAQDGTIFAHTAEGLFKSVDGGTTFATVTPNIPGATHVATAMTSLSPGYREAGPDRRLWVAVIAIKGSGAQMRQVGDVFSSSDGGATWTGVGAPGPFGKGAIAVAAAPDGRVFAAVGPLQGGGLLCSSDGSTWHPSCSAGVQKAGPLTATGPPAPKPACTGGSCSVAATSAPPSGTAAPAVPSAAVPPVTGSGGVAASGAKRSLGIPVLPVGLGALSVAAGAVTLLMRRRRRQLLARSRMGPPGRLPRP
jgi:hypothetical protein